MDVCLNDGMNDLSGFYLDGNTATEMYKLHFLLGHLGEFEFTISSFSVQESLLLKHFVLCHEELLNEILPYTYG